MNQRFQRSFRVAAAIGLVFAPLLYSNAPAAEEPATTYYVQLIRGSNDAKPPVPSSAIGPKLSARLRPVFTWVNYWEVARREVPLAAGGKARVKLSNEREVEIDLTQTAKRTVTVFSGGQPVIRTTRPDGQSMVVIGGDRSKETAWFIVVRRDKPSN